MPLFPRVTVPKDVRARNTPSAPEPGDDGRTIPERIRAAGLQIFPPGFYPPYGALNWMITGNQAMPGASTTFFTGARASFTLPDGSSGYGIEALIIVNNLLITSDITVAIMVNEAPAPGFDLISMPQAGMAVYAWAPEKVYIPIPDHATIKVKVTVVDAPAYNISMMVRGWHYITEMDDRWRGLAGK